MQLESKRIESIIHYWIIMEEMKLRKQQLQAKDLAVGAAHEPHDDYLRVPEHCIQVRQKF